MSHFTTEEREKILISLNKGNSKHSIAKELNRSVSTISREIKRNTHPGKSYSAAAP